MQWILAFVAAIIATSLNEHIWVWAVIGFLMGYVLKIAPRVTQLERQIEYLQTEISQLKGTHIEEEEEEPDQPAWAITALVEEPPEAQTEDTSWLLEAVAQQFSTKPEPEPYSPPVSTEPSDLEKLYNYAWRWFSDGNTFVRVGIVILFVGVSFLLNLAIDRGYVPIELRLSAVAAAAIALLALGWRLRESRGAYALLIQGGAVGLLYLTIFAGYNLYHLLPSALAFALLVLLVALSATLAVLENTSSLALLGSIGGFLAPILTSSGTNNYVGLFSFYAVLNAGIFAIAWFKAWRLLNWVGFTFTFAIGAFWGAGNYQPENFATVEPFLILFFLFYTGIAVLYATRRIPDFKDPIDGTLIFGTPILAFGLQAAMVKDYEYGVAISAFVLSLFYLALAAWVWKRFSESLKFLSETLLSVCVIFITLAIPFALDGSTTSATWAVEGTGVLWVSIRQQHVVRRIFALGLQFCAGVALLTDAASATHGAAFFNSGFIGVVIVSICGGLSSWLLSRDFTGRRKFEQMLSPLLFAYSLIGLFAGYNYQIEQHDLLPVQSDLLLSLTVVLTVLLTQLGRRLQWTASNYAALSMMLPLILSSLVIFNQLSHPSAGYGLGLWPLAFAAYFLSLKNAGQISPNTRLNLHIFTGLFLAVLLFWEGFWQLLLVGSMLSLLFNALASRYQWPQLRILAFGLFPVMVFLAISSFFTHTMHPFDLPDTSTGVSWPFEAGYLLWPVAFGALYWLFYDDKKQRCPASFRGLSLLLLVILSTWEASWHLSEHLELVNGWHIALFPLLPSIALWLIMLPKCWPFTRYRNDYLNWTAKPLIWGLILWSLVALKSPADASPLPWLPLINPAELMQAIVLATGLRFISLLPEQQLSKTQKRSRYLQIACFSFIWLNFMLLRTLHHWAGLFWSERLLHQPLTQTSLSIFWTLTGLSLAIAATKNQLRPLWIVGAALLTVVVVKLFLFDLHAHDSMERIISFISVGALLMLIGYFAPLPPKRQERTNA